MKKFILVSLLFVGISVFPSGARATTGSGGISVSPSFQEVTITEDAKESFPVTLTNQGTTALTFRVSLLDFGSLDESGGVAFLGAGNDLEKKYALAAWMHPDRDVVTLGPGEAGTVTMTIENRDTLSPGGHYGAVVFKIGDETGQPVVDNRVAVNQLLSVLVFVKKVGGEVYDLSLKSEEHPHSLLSLPDTARLRFQNDGNTHAVPRGIVSVTDPLGREVLRGIINQESAIVLPETLRVLPVPLEKMMTAYVPGRYTLSVSYRYDGKDEFTVFMTKFDFIPVPATLGFLAVVSISGWYVARRRRNPGERERAETRV